MDTTEEPLCLSTSEGDGNRCFSERLSGEGEVDDRHTPPGNALRYLRRHRVTRVRLILWRQARWPRLETEGELGSLGSL